MSALPFISFNNSVRSAVIKPGMANLTQSVITKGENDALHLAHQLTPTGLGTLFATSVAGNATVALAKRALEDSGLKRSTPTKVLQNLYPSMNLIFQKTPGFTKLAIAGATGFGAYKALKSILFDGEKEGQRVIKKETRTYRQQAGV